MKKLFCYMTGDDFANTLWWSRRVFNNEINSWRYLFRNDYLCSAMHSFLMGEPEPEQVAFSNGTDYEQIIYSLAHTKLLDFVMDKIPNSWIRSGYHYHTAIFPSSTGVFLNAKLRDEILNDSAITVSEEIKVPETSFLWCNDADFKTTTTSAESKAITKSLPSVQIRKWTTKISILGKRKCLSNLIRL